MTDRFNGLTAGEDERLSWLVEEMGEALQIIGKIKRHGYASTNNGQMAEDNRALLEKELGDVHAAIELLAESGDVKRETIVQRIHHKRESVMQWMHHQDRVDRRLAPYTELEITVRSFHCLRHYEQGHHHQPHGILPLPITVGILQRASDADLLKLKNFGRVCLADVRRAVAEYLNGGAE